MRRWLLLGLAVLLVSAVGCTSSIHPAIRDGEGAPTADSGQIAKGTTGGDAAGTLNLDSSHQGEEAPANDRRGRGRRGGGDGA